MTRTVTLNDIRKHRPCQDGWEKLLRHLGKTKADDEPLSLETILGSNGLDDALWCLRALPSEHDNAVRLLACDFAEPALKYVPDDEPRPRQAVETVRRYANGKASKEELDAAADAADAAVWVARAAAWSAARAAWRAAWSAVWATDAAWSAVWVADAAAQAADAADAADAAARVAWSAARAAADSADTARAEQERIFREWLK